MKNNNMLSSEIKLRLLIREVIKIKNKQNEQEENKLRTVIQYLLKEAGEIDSDTQPAPYASTAVNALADAFNQILPVLKTGLRKLAKPEERLSYRAHVLEKFKSIFDNFEGLDSEAEEMIGESGLNEQEEEKEEGITIKIDDPDRIMPSDGKEDDRFKEPEKDPEAEVEEEFDTFKIAGENPTGARVAFETINDSNIVQVLSDKRKLLFDTEYKQEFKMYALYNVDLWLLTYEKELADAMGQMPAFDSTIMEKPSGAQISGAAAEFDVEEEMPEMPAEEEMPPGIPNLGEF